MNNLKSLKIFIQDNPSFTEGGMRNLIFNERSNGLVESAAIIRVGRKILIDEAKFYQIYPRRCGIQQTSRLRICTNRTIPAGSISIHFPTSNLLKKLL